MEPATICSAIHSLKMWIVWIKKLLVEVLIHNDLNVLYDFVGTVKLKRSM